MFQDIEDKFFLFEDFESVGRFLGFAFFAHICNEGECFSIKGSGGILFVLRRSNDEEVVDILTTLDYPIEIFCGDLFCIEIVKDGDGVIEVIVSSDVKRREDLPFIIELVVVVLGFELLELDVFRLIIDDVLAVLKYFDDGVVDFEAPV